MRIHEHHAQVGRAHSSDENLERASAHGPRGVRERVGAAIGVALAPTVAAISRARHARMFHPVGLTFTGYCEAAIGGAFARLGAELEGRVLARCSGALWKRRIGHFEVLGIGLRIRPGKGFSLCEEPAPGDQDLLFATIRSPLTMVLSPFTTDATDFVRNRYWAVSPFAIRAYRHVRVELRLSPIDPPRLAGNRDDRLRVAVATGLAAWRLEARRTLTLQWHEVARITLAAEVALDQAALHFDPFRTGAGLEPVGLVHAIRRAVYPASQRARPQDDETSG